jgi:hypothetical protein
VRLVEDCLEHRREIARRGVDDAEHLGGGRLLLQGLAGLGDEPRVFHRDHRLRGKILQEGDLLGREGSDFTAINREISQKCRLLHEGYR